MMEEDEQIRLKLRGDILNALSKVYSRDRELLGDEIDVCERSLMHRFTHYFIPIVEGCTRRRRDKLYARLHVDGEYNRQGEESRCKERNGKPIYPDVIVHNRADSKHNLCVIEFKKSGREKYLNDEQGFTTDEDKLCYLTNSEKCNYHYEWGVYIVFYANKNEPDGRYVTLQWFKDGGEFGEVEKVSLPLEGGKIPEFSLPLLDAAELDKCLRCNTYDQLPNGVETFKVIKIKD